MVHDGQHCSLVCPTVGTLFRGRLPDLRPLLHFAREEVVEAQWGVKRRSWSH